ncbi:MAG TPA: DUF1571 domain-containing protein [Phycisphaerae bacterium]|jgi:hypothetical protein|nr:DUF1571 domain-containing protein [Phycisphaerae bacterium]HOB73780.1 DUF1571 domain-containing protein [Phycisphaerae bacterium]HOJ56236.1 DUF1571 domain-containing protein [Phycisphaerae bacterium]HOL27116.1 DUF1571 domain-containing protein [Phycisphaerae bacterium]HPP21248.1 DUF1571 domain-containing protein [Phycisphaerae bacterium]
MSKPRITSGRIQVVIGLVLLAALIFQCHRALTAKARQPQTPVAVQEPVRHRPSVAFAAPAPPSPVSEPPEALAARDPMGFLQMAMERYDRTVRDYTCTFTKKELIGGKLTGEQVIDVWFREKPFSVRMEWKRNADKISRVLYVADRWIDEGRQMALVEPAGSIARLFVSCVMRPINGEEAKRSSRRTIDQFGMRNSLALTLKYARLAQEKNLLDLSYKGKGEVDGRPTFIFERRLPYTDEHGIWPDRVLVVHMDQEMLLPVLCLAYADDERKILLGHYEITNVKLNPNLPDSVFTKEGMGF